MDPLRKQLLDETFGAIRRKVEYLSEHPEAKMDWFDLFRSIGKNEHRFSIPTKIAMRYVVTEAFGHLSINKFDLPYWYQMIEMANGAIDKGGSKAQSKTIYHGCKDIKKIANLKIDIIRYNESHPPKPSDLRHQKPERKSKKRPHQAGLFDDMPKRPSKK